jgi:PAS domain-containing protein
MKFLIIDDNPGDRELIVRQLRREFGDAECVEVFQRKDFEAAVARGDVDVVLTDYQLNWTDGLWILSMCRAYLPDIPVIMFTDTGGEEIAVDGMKAGLSDYVLKSHPQRMPIAVKESLEKAQLRRARDAAEAALRQEKATLERRVEERTIALKALNEQLLTDIAERHRMEALLRESEERFRSVFEHSFDGVLLTLTNGRILAANPAACQMFGWTAEEICQVGMTGLADATAPRLAAALEERARTGKFTGTAITLTFAELPPRGSR